MRYFNNQPVELLAPAGNFEIFKGVVESKCDAIYFGGQTLNMRLIRKGFNFSDQEIKEAVKMAHDRNKRCFITVNNLINTFELEEAKRFLAYLATCDIDGIIVQDMAILALANELGLPFERHASVMMNTHNSESVRQLQRMGVNRVVLSREMTLAQAQAIKAETGIETEYFTHGDMCIAHGAQCYHSSHVFGMSSNRGRCLKPCRWGYQTQKGSEHTYPMAVKDLSMYEHLPEMIASGITSFKLEGRMRELDFITALINDYGEALDRYIEAPEAFDRQVASERLFETRKRDLSTGYAFGNPGAKNLNTRYEGTGKFYSTGKVFSTPTSETAVHAETIEALVKKLKAERTEFAAQCKPQVDSKNKRLILKVNDVEQAEAAIKHGSDLVILSGDVLGGKGWPAASSVAKLHRNAKEKGAKLYLGLPRMLWNHQFKLCDDYLEGLKGAYDGLSVSHIGALTHFKAYNVPMHLDFGANVYSGEALRTYEALGASDVTVSLELKHQELQALLSDSPFATVVVYGRIPTMYYEHDFSEAPSLCDAENAKLSEGHNLKGSNLKLKTTLYNEAGTFEIYRDQLGRNHLYSEKTLDLTAFVDLLCIHNLQIEAQLLTTEQIEGVIKGLKLQAGMDMTLPMEAKTMGAFAFEL